VQFFIIILLYKIYLIALIYTIYLPDNLIKNFKKILIYFFQEEQVFINHELISVRIIIIQIKIQYLYTLLKSFNIIT